MPKPIIEYHDEEERVAMERAIVYLADLRHLALEASEGTVVDACEGLALDKGRASLRSALAAAPHGRVAVAGRKGGPHRPAPRRTPGAPRGVTPVPS